MSAETELSLLEWGLGIASAVGIGFATIISSAFGTMREQQNLLRRESGEAIDAVWDRINSITDGEANRRENLADKYATKQDLRDAVAHLDARLSEMTQTIRDLDRRNGK